MKRGFTTAAAAAAFVMSGLAVAPANAAPAPVHTKVPCTTPRNDVHVPPIHRRDLTPKVTERDLNAVPKLPTPGSVRADGRPAVRVAGFPTTATVPVYVHVIRGTKRGEHTPYGAARIRYMMSRLNGGFHGLQLSSSKRAGHVAPFKFVLRSADYHTRESWYHADSFGARDKQMIRALHRGGKGDLNVYINGGPNGSGVFGWTRFPWQQASSPRLDSVNVNWHAMPGGTYPRYDTGDTLVHETGHWLGLFHTFQGGCGATGDQVADTPAEASPNFACPTARNTCLAPGNDPVHNFMDYSYDGCMNRFSAGQIRRMEYAWVKYRK